MQTYMKIYMKKYGQAYEHFPGIHNLLLIAVPSRENQSCLIKRQLPSPRHTCLESRYSE